MKKDFDYISAKKELEEIIDWFESNNASIDESIEKFHRANKLIKILQKHLDDAKTKLKIELKK